MLKLAQFVKVMNLFIQGGKVERTAVSQNTKYVIAGASMFGSWVLTWIVLSIGAVSHAFVVGFIIAAVLLGGAFAARHRFKFTGWEETTFWLSVAVFSTYCLAWSLPWAWDLVFWLAFLATILAAIAVLIVSLVRRSRA